MYLMFILQFSLLFLSYVNSIRVMEIASICNIKDTQLFPVLHENMKEISLSFMLGCFLDLDHFIGGKSFTLYSATHLNQRPFGHNLFSLFSIFIVVFLFISRRLSLLFFMSIFSHLLRDSIKRGFTFFPGSISTPKVPYILYVLTIIFLPIVMSYMHNKTPNFWRKSSFFSSSPTLLPIFNIRNTII